jgi:hypothetical protein
VVYRIGFADPSAERITRRYCMAYYTRIIPVGHNTGFSKRWGVLLKSRLSGRVPSLEKGTETAWEQVLLSFSSGEEIALVERDRVRRALWLSRNSKRSWTKSRAAVPASAVEWLNDYLQKVTQYLLSIFAGPSRKPAGIYGSPQVSYGRGRRNPAGRP